MSHTVQTRPDFDVASYNDQDREQHPPHATKTVQYDDSGVEEREADENMKVSLVLAHQTLVSSERSSTNVHRLQELTTNGA